MLPLTVGVAGPSQTRHPATNDRFGRRAVDGELVDDRARLPTRQWLGAGLLRCNSARQLPAPKLRPLEPGDHLAPVALWRRTPVVGLSAANRAEPVAAFLQRNPSCSFMAEVDGQLAGTLLSGHDDQRFLYTIDI